MPKTVCLFDEGCELLLPAPAERQERARLGCQAIKRLLERDRSGPDGLAFLPVAVVLRVDQERQVHTLSPRRPIGLERNDVVRPPLQVGGVSLDSLPTILRQHADDRVALSCHAGFSATGSTTVSRAGSPPLCGAFGQRIREKDAQVSDDVRIIPCSAYCRYGARSPIAHHCLSTDPQNRLPSDGILNATSRMNGLRLMTRAYLFGRNVSIVLTGVPLTDTSDQSFRVVPVAHILLKP